MIDAHIADERGVYLRTEHVDSMGPQPADAIYAELPEAQEGFTRMWEAGTWVQVPDAEVPAEPGPPPDPVPTSCTRRQGLLALLSFGVKRADIETQIEAIEDEIEREEAWIEYLANDWELTNPRLQQMWAALGGQSAQLVDLFRLAVTL